MKPILLLAITAHFERQLHKDKNGELQLLVNAINGQQATVGAGYVQAIIQSFNQEIRQEASLTVVNMPQTRAAFIQTEFMNWYNPQLNNKYFRVPGIMAQLTTILVMLLTAMNIVRERELGTIEQINVTSIRKWEFILGKMIPFLIVGFVLLMVGLAAGKLIFAIPIRGSLLVVFLRAGQSNCGIGAGTIYLKSFRYATAGHVHDLLFCYNIYTYEWSVHSD